MTILDMIDISEIKPEIIELSGNRVHSKEELKEMIKSILQTPVEKKKKKRHFIFGN